MTQPLMTDLIEAKRSTRRIYTSALVGRGDITEEEYEKAKQDFQDRLERAFMETHAPQTGSIPVIDQSGIAEPTNPRTSRLRRSTPRSRPLSCTASATHTQMFPKASPCTGSCNSFWQSAKR